MVGQSQSKGLKTTAVTDAKKKDPTLSWGICVTCFRYASDSAWKLDEITERRFLKFESVAIFQGALHSLEKRMRFFQNKGFLRILDGFFLKTKRFLPKVYKIFWSEMPLAIFIEYTGLHSAS